MPPPKKVLFTPQGSQELPGQLEVLMSELEPSIFDALRKWGGPCGELLLQGSQPASVAPWSQCAECFLHTAELMAGTLLPYLQVWEAT